MKKPLTAEQTRSYADGSYWERRSDLLYYQYFRYILRCIGAEARSLVDIGSGNAPYLEWFDWIPERVSVDLTTPYRSEAVRGVVGDILTLDLPRADLCTCLQVLEHVEAPEPFARRLLELGALVLVSVPFRWPANANRNHVNDPVDLAKLNGWFGRPANWRMVVREPFAGPKGARLFALYDPADPDRRFGVATRHGRRPA